MAAFVLASAAAPTADPPFPTYPNSFTYDLNAYDDHAANTTFAESFTWDISNGKSKYILNTTATGAFRYELRRCDLGKEWLINGVTGADPSTFTCKLLAKPFLPCPIQQYWFPPPPGAAVWNGTDTINGLKCDRFDISNPMGRQTFWGTPTTPCRAITNNGVYQQQNYLNWVPTAPPAAVFDPPAFLSSITCAPVPVEEAVATTNVLDLSGATNAKVDAAGSISPQHRAQQLREEAKLLLGLDLGAPCGSGACSGVDCGVAIAACAASCALSFPEGCVSCIGAYPSCCRCASAHFGFDCNYC